MQWAGVKLGEKRLLTRLACAFCKQRARSNRKQKQNRSSGQLLEKQGNKQTERKKRKKSMATTWNAEAKVFFVLDSHYSTCELNDMDSLS